MIYDYSETDGLAIFREVRNRADVRARIGIAYEVLPKTEFSDNSTDVFGSVVMRVWYTATDIISGVELYYPKAKFLLYGQQVLGCTVRELRLKVQAPDLILEEDADGTGFNVKDDTVRFFVPDWLEKGELATVDSIYLQIPDD
jgi:hypothetical protein